MQRTELNRTRGRPRGFDPEQAVATAQRLFHAHGYDAVSVADLTRTLGINPPSFYAAFGSKAGLYDRILNRYALAGAIPLQELLDPDRTVAACLEAVLLDAATRYAADPVAAGCIVIEGARSTDKGAREASGAYLAGAEDVLRRFIAARHPKEAERLTNYMSTVMAGLSASARNGHDLERLLASARLASEAFAHVDID